MSVSFCERGGTEKRSAIGRGRATCDGDKVERDVLVRQRGHVQEGVGSHDDLRTGSMKRVWYDLFWVIVYVVCRCEIVIY